MTTEELRGMYWRSVEKALEILNSPNPDFNELEAVLAPLVEDKDSKYSETISELCSSLSAGEYEVDDAISLLEDFYEELL